VTEQKKPIQRHADGSWTLDGKPAKVSLSFKTGDGTEHTVPLSDAEAFAYTQESSDDEG
jgi:hypothetical protein